MSWNPVRFAKPEPKGLGYSLTLPYALYDLDDERRVGIARDWLHGFAPAAIEQDSCGLYLHGWRHTLVGGRETGEFLDTSFSMSPRK